MVYRKDARIGGACVQKRVKKMAQVKIKKMAQGKIARRLAFARLNAVRCGGGMTPFSHHNSSQATYAKHTQSSPASHIQQKEKPFPKAIRRNKWEKGTERMGETERETERRRETEGRRETKK